jgi:hypothetical protein
MNSKKCCCGCGGEKKNSTSKGSRQTGKTR